MLLVVGRDLLAELLDARMELVLLDADATGAGVGARPPPRLRTGVRVEPLIDERLRADLERGVLLVFTAYAATAARPPLERNLARTERRLHASVSARSRSRTRREAST